MHHKLINSLGEHKRGVNADDFKLFLTELAPKIPRGSVLIIDNARIHHAETLGTVFSLLHSSLGIDVVYLPPYSPFLNPIEYAFNDLKAQVKQCEFYNRGELVRAINQKIPNITPEKAERFYHKALQYWPQAAMKFPFRGKPLDPELLRNISHTSPQLLLEDASAVHE